MFDGFWFGSVFFFEKCLRKFNYFGNQGPRAIWVPARFEDSHGFTVWDLVYYVTYVDGAGETNTLDIGLEYL